MAKGLQSLNARIKQSQKLFFYDRNGRQRIFAGVDKARTKVLNQQGAIIRTISRRSMKKARRRKLSEMSSEERKEFKQRQREAKARGRKAHPGFAASKPGEPPRTRIGTVKKFLYYRYDPTTKTLVVGPVKTGGTGAPATLEFGGNNDKGNRIEPRPYMRPAEKQARSKFAPLFKDTIK